MLSGILKTVVWALKTTCSELPNGTCGKTAWLGTLASARHVAVQAGGVESPSYVVSCFIFIVNRSDGLIIWLSVQFAPWSETVSWIVRLRQ